MGEAFTVIFVRELFAFGAWLWAWGHQTMPGPRVIAKAPKAGGGPDTLYDTRRGYDADWVHAQCRRSGE